MGIDFDDSYWMRQAYKQALLAKAEAEVPVGAVLVAKDNVLLAANRNAVESSFDPSAHAEMLVICEAANRLQNHRLLHTTLYVTLEPCAMCAGLMVHARIHRVVFATRDFKAGACGSVVNLLQGHPFNHQVLIDEGLMQEECAGLLTDFFRVRR
jgi:tRNA(adenine34) deaminase